MVKNKVGKIFVSDTRVSPLTQRIISDLQESMLTKKEIANKNGVDLAEVMRIAKRFNLGTLKIENKKILMNGVDITPTDVTEPKGETDISTADDDTTPVYGLGGRRVKLSDDTILEIVNDLEDGKLSLIEIAQKHRVSITSVRRYGIKFGVLKEKKDKKETTEREAEEVKAKEVKEEVVTEEKKDEPAPQPPVTIKTAAPQYTTISKRETLKVGMIKDRHEMPEWIKTYIFNSAIPRHEINNFAKLDGTVSEFLLSNIKVMKDKDGNFCGDRDLEVYVTGLQSPLASIIKMTQINGINLTLMHFNPAINAYEPQVIWDSFGKTELEKLTEGFTSTTLVKCNFEDLDKDNFYTIRVIDFSNYSSSKGKNIWDTLLYIFADEMELWRFYADLLVDIMTNKQIQKSIFAENSKISDDKIVFEKRLSQSCNFKSIS